MLAHLRSVIRGADPEVIEEVKWRKPSRPEGVPAWSLDGMICIGELLKNAVRLTFPNGALIRDPKRLFNARLASRTVRAIDIPRGGALDEVALEDLVLGVVELNRVKVRERGRPRRGQRRSVEAPATSPSEPAAAD